MSRKKRKSAPARSGAEVPAAKMHGAGKPRSARPAPDIVTLALAVAGLLLTAYLTLVAWRDGTPAFCSEGSACDVIQSSEWSSLLGLPIAFWGFGLYALIALAMVSASALARWRWQSRLSLLGVVISVYLTVAGIVALGAVCAWCLLSLALLVAIFVRVHLRRPASAPGNRTAWPNWWLGNGLVALALVAALQLSASGLLDQRPEHPQVAALVDHLDATGVRYYGASWCANCRRQTRLFGASSDRLPYVECSPQGQGGPVALACVSAGVTAYPTWMIRGQPHAGVKTPQELAQLTGFEWQ